jgi:ATPases involved in chromosome partitioning
MRVLNTDGVVRLAEPGRPKDHADDRGHGSLHDPTAAPAFLHLIQILLRRRWLILAIAALGTLFAGVLALLVPPQYTAAAQLTVDRPSGGGQASERILDEIIDTHLALLGSPDHLRRVAASLQPPQPVQAAVPAPAAREDVARNPEQGAEGPPDLRQRMLQRLAIWIPSLSGSSEADRFLENLFRKTTVLQERRSRLISVAFTSPDPQTAATYANRIAEAYVGSLEQQMEANAAAQLREIDRQVDAARNEVRTAQQAVQDAIRRRVGALSAPSGVADADREIRDLTRASREATEFHDNLLRRRTEMKEAQASIRPGISVQSRAAVPMWPSSHNPLLFIIPSACLSLMAGCWLALILERADRRLRSDREVQRVLGIPCIGLLPRVRGGAVAAPRLHILNHPSSPYSEAVRNIAAALQAHHAGRGSRVVLVTSSLPGEGKSTLATGLSAYFGTLGRRVLLIDLDILPAAERPREPASSAIRRSPSREQMREMIAPQPELGVDYLGLSRLGVDPLLFFEPEGLPRLMTDLRKSYDVIVVGGPPVLGASEARLLPSIADQVLFVVRWASTKRDVAEHALSFLRRFHSVDEPGLGATFAVLSHVKLKQQARLSFSDAGDGPGTLGLGPDRPPPADRAPVRTPAQAASVERSA